jgi:hypothetical protein
MEERHLPTYILCIAYIARCLLSSFVSGLQILVCTPQIRHGPPDRLLRLRCNLYDDGLDLPFGVGYRYSKVLSWDGPEFGFGAYPNPDTSWLRPHFYEFGD